LNPDQLTESALQAVATAQQNAQTAGHQQLTPTHLLQALLTQDQAARLLQTAGADLPALQESITANLQITDCP